MAASKVLLDTNILSAIMKGSEAVMPKAREYLTEHGTFTFSIITRYEVLRGLKAKNAVAQAEAFDKLCAASEVLGLSNDIVVKAAEVHATLRARGEPIGDADILIEATALVQGLAVATDNEDHSRRIPSLTVENWLRG